MNLRKKRIFRSILISIVMIILSATPVLATVTGILGGDPEPNGGELSGMGDSILGYVVWFGWAIAVGMILVIAIRYMMASANERADLKNGSIRYIVGVLLLATLITVFNGIMGIFSESEGEAGGTNQTTQGGGTQHGGGGSSNGSNSGGGNKNDTKKAKVITPTLTGDSTYNGKVQKAPLGNIDSSKVNISYYEADGKTPSTNELTNVGEKKIIKLIPIGLNICPTGKWVFITDKELMTMHEKAYTYEEKKMINKFTEECVKDIKSLKYNNLFSPKITKIILYLIPTRILF